jgi:hypothetical protein
VIRPERNETFDKRAVGRHALQERRTPLGCGNAHEGTASLLTRLALLRVADLGNGPERADRISDGIPRAFNRRRQRRRISAELCAQPTARVVTEPLALARAGAEPEAV